MNAVTERFNKQVCAQILRAGGTPLLRHALSPAAPLELRNNVLTGLGEHFYLEPATGRPEPTATVEETVEGDTFPEYVGTADGYYVTPNALFMDTFARHPRKFSHGARVVDLGSGTGRNGLVAALAGAQVTLLERSHAGNEFAAAQACELGVDASVSTLTMSMQDWQPEPASVDSVVTITTLEHLTRPDRQVLSRKITRALAPGGLLVASVFLDDDPGATQQQAASETAGHVLSYFAHGELAMLFGDLRQEHYREYRKLDTSHGPAHYHSRADLVAVAPH